MHPLTIMIFAIILAVISDVFYLVAVRRPGRLNIFTPLGFYFWTFLATVQIPGFILFYAARWYEYGGAAVFPIAIALAPLFVGLGSLLVFRAPGSEWELWWQRPVEVLPRDLTVGRIFVIVMLMILVVHTALVGVSNIPLINMIRYAGRSAFLTQMREQALRMQPWYVVYAVLWNIRVFAPIAASVFCVRYVLTRRGRWGFIAVLMLAIFAVSFHGARSPAGVLALAVYLTALHSRGRRLNARRAMVAFIILSVGAGVTQQLKYGRTFTVSNLAVTYSELAGRLFYATPWTIVASMRYLDEYEGGHFLMGKTVRIWCLLTGQRPVPVAWLVAQRYMVGAHATATANTSYIGDAYVNFGLPGVLIAALIAGLVMGIVERLVYTTPRTFFSASLVTVFAVKTVWLNCSALQVWLLTHGALIFMLLIFWYRSWRLGAAGPTPLHGLAAYRVYGYSNQSSGAKG